MSGLVDLAHPWALAFAVVDEQLLGSLYGRLDHYSIAMIECGAQGGE